MNEGSQERDVKAQSDTAPILRELHTGMIEFGLGQIRGIATDDQRSRVPLTEMRRLLGVERGGKGVLQTTEVVGEPSVLDLPDNLKSVLPKDFEVVGKLLEYRPKKGGGKGGIAHAVDPDFVMTVCEGYIRLAIVGELRENQRQIAIRCHALQSMCSRIGLENVIRAACGLNTTAEQVREAQSLYVAGEFFPWEKTFPPEFYEELYRLTNLTPAGNGHPRLFAALTADWVYRTLPQGEGVLDELRRVVPMGLNGERALKLHQAIRRDNGAYTVLRLHVKAIQRALHGCQSMPEARRVINKHFDTGLIAMDLFQDEDVPEGVSRN